MCQSIKCNKCQAPTPSCSLRKGMCPSCYSVSLDVKK